MNRKKVRVRQLRDGEQPPAGVIPFRMRNADGYIRLRWRVALREYVDCYEHRFVMKARRGQQVHHLNGVKDDNRPENLKVMTPKEHGAEHVRYPVDEIVRLYQEGNSTPDIAAVLGCDSAVAFRALQRSGIPMRSAGEASRLSWATKPRNRKLDDVIVARLYLSGMSTAEVAAACGVTSRSILVSLDRSGTPKRTRRSSA